MSERNVSPIEPTEDVYPSESELSASGDAEDDVQDVTVIVDVHEPDQLKILSMGHPDVDNWREAPLDAADLIVNGIGFERKTASDFASSMLEDRLDEQVRKLNQGYDDAMILIEGGFDDFSALERTDLNPASMRGKAASVHMRFGIPVIPTGGSASTETGHRLLVDYAIRLARKGTVDEESSYLPTGTVGSDEPSAKMMWGCLPHVGVTMANRLYDEFGSPLRIAHDSSAARLDKLQLIDGIGEKTAKEINAAMWGQDQ